MSKIYRIKASAAILATTAYGERAIEGVVFGRPPQLVRDPPERVVKDDYLFVELVDHKSLAADEKVVKWDDLVAATKQGPAAPEAKAQESSKVDGKAKPKGKADGRSTPKGKVQAKAT